MARFPAFLDTCSIYGAYLCDTLLRLAEEGAFRPLWSAEVMEELERNLLELGLPGEAVKHRISAMRGAFPDAEVTGYEALTSAVTCDPKDRHVLAAAVRGHAEVLVTLAATTSAIGSGVHSGGAGGRARARRSLWMPHRSRAAVPALTG